MALHVWSDNCYTYKEGDCPWTEAEFDDMSWAEVKSLAREGGYCYARHIEDHSDKYVTVKAIQSCYSAYAKYKQGLRYKYAQKWMNETAFGRYCRAIKDMEEV